MLYCGAGAAAARVAKTMGRERRSSGRRIVGLELEGGGLGGWFGERVERGSEEGVVIRGRTDGLVIWMVQVVIRSTAV